MDEAGKERARKDCVSALSPDHFWLPRRGQRRCLGRSHPTAKRGGSISRRQSDESKRLSFAWRAPAEIEAIIYALLPPPLLLLRPGLRCHSARETKAGKKRRGRGRPTGATPSSTHCPRLAVVAADDDDDCGRAAAGGREEQEREGA